MQRNVERAQKTYELIKTFPGIDYPTLQLMLGIDNGALHGTLGACYHLGLLIYEDDDDRLYVYEEKYDDYGILL